ncbi:penicillin acylase family protein [Jannaschia aquimarina]|uniref:QuiP protein n=1 Tax=Jannaschia aquimarina TaxID=935700 RepID=A0A0D1CMT0_9RHOB|nr:penicillin acylase family protein [Jannaschia aquimarina]KIT16102.1 Acyl-homoserine lactone acylase QuiP precursor [Jannaschia aquimarina]SNT02430.1 penicillin amidase [Jannaschia aquimarina]
MERLFRWTFRIVVFVLVATGVMLGTLFWFTSRSLPDYDRTLKVTGIDSPVEIVRNTHNIPHIFGETDADVFFGLGYAHAQDRLWQMTLMRRTAQGRLSEIFGAETLRTDELLRRLGLYRSANRAARLQDSETLAMLEAYSAGVNARINVINEGAEGRGAPEFFLFPPEIAPWRPADSIAVMKLMALQLSSHASEESARARALLVLSEERLRDLHPDIPGDGTAVLAGDLFPTLDHTRFAAAGPRPPLWPIAPRGLAGASNAFAVGPDHAASGGALMANDPHLGLTAPTIWYLARLDLRTGGVIGGTIPGMPVVLAGRSDVLGWGLTTAYLDDQDVVIEELNPEDPTEYRTPGGWTEFETEGSIIRIKDETPVTLTLRRTRNGPVLTGSQFDLGQVTPPGHVAALQWTALTEADTSMRTGLELMRARSIEDGLAAARHLVAPAQMLTLASEDRIAMVMMGAQPDRDPAHQSQGRIPAPGWIDANVWSGTKPFDDNPVWIDPESGMLGNTNNKIVDRPFPDHVSFHWGDTQRVQRMEELLSRRDIHTRQSLIEAQLDTVSFAARALLPLVGRDLWFTGEAAPPGTPERRRQDALALLAAWNGEMSEHLPEPLIYAAWMRALQDRLIRDDLGPLADEYSRMIPLFVERVFRDIDGASAWCDVIQSVPVETCTDVARLSLDDALQSLEDQYGGSPESWRWGDAHEAHHDHPVLGDIPFLGAVVNIRQSTSGGDHTLQRGRTSGEAPTPFANVHAGTYRGVYDFADPESSVFITSTGQSGHPLSRHYDDLGVLWRRGEYIPMTLDPDLARAGAVGITVLEPL